MRLSTTKTVDLMSVPDAKLIFKIMTEGARNRLMLKLASAMGRVRELQGQLAHLTDADEADVYKVLDESARINRLEVRPAYVEECFVRLDGVAVDDQPIDSVEKLMNLAPESLYAEVADVISKECGLTADEKQDFESPTTSAAGEGGRTSDSTAASVDEPSTT